MSADREEVDQVDRVDSDGDRIVSVHDRAPVGAVIADVPAPSGRATRTLGTLDITLLLACISALVAVEALLIAGGDVLTGEIADGVLLLLMLQLGPRPALRGRSLISQPARQAIGALALVPLIRVVAIGLPLREGSSAAGTLVIAAIIGVSAWLLAPSAGVHRRALLAFRRPVFQLPAVVGGLGIGLLAYGLGAPALWSPGAPHDRVVVALLAAGCAAAVEELVFRGMVQLPLTRAIGGFGVLAASALFTATYLKLGSVPLVLTVALAGLVFAFSVEQTRAVGGAVVGHVLFALGAGGVWRSLLGPAPVPPPEATIWMAASTAGMAAILIGVHLIAVEEPTAIAVAGEDSREPPDQARRVYRAPEHVQLSGEPPPRAESRQRGPVVGIIICNHNYAQFLSEAIDSACAQDHPEVRIVVVDDGSTDDSREVLRRYEGVVDVVLKENGGQASAINAGLAQCQADIVMLLDADDVLKPGAASRVAAVFASDPGVAKLQFRMDVIDANGRATGMTKPWPHIPMPNGDLRAAELAFPFDLSWLGGGGTAFRMDALRRILPIPEDEYPLRGADWYLVHLTTLLGSVVSLPDVCASYRVHGRNGYEPQVPRLDLDHVRETIGYSEVTARALARLADELGLHHPEPILSLSELGNRLVSLRLEPDRHPVPSDRPWRLVVSAVRAARRRFDIDWPLKAMFVVWFAATAAAPPALAHRLAERFVFPERRPSLNAWLSRMHRAGPSPVPTPPREMRGP